jgi:hypothetical protein
MKHLSEEQFVSMYYEGLTDKEARHFDGCADCQAAFERMKAFLNEVRSMPVPTRNANYGREVWARLQSRLPLESKTGSLLSWRWLTPALAAIVLISFFAGMFVQRRNLPAGNLSDARTRVLLIAMSDHLNRSQMMLAELVNADPKEVDLTDERVRARDLLAENRLLRTTAVRTNGPVEASVLDQLERVFMDIANGPVNPSPEELEELQHRIESEGLLFKVRIIGANTRPRGQKL